MKCSRPGCGGDIVVKNHAAVSFLWLRQLSQVRDGVLGQACKRNLPAMPGAVPARENHEEAGNLPPLCQEECGLSLE